MRCNRYGERTTSTPSSLDARWGDMHHLGTCVLPVSACPHPHTVPAAAWPKRIGGVRKMNGTLAWLRKHKRAPAAVRRQNVED